MALTEKEEKKKPIDNLTYKAEKEERQQVAGISYRELKALPGNTIKEKLEKKLGITLAPNITLKEAIKLYEDRK